MRPSVQTVLRLLTWGLLAALVFVTLAPIGMRPVLGPPTFERVAAYAALGLVAAFAYPRRRVAVLLGVVLAAGLLEYGQMLTATRHGRLADFLVKAGGGTAGWLAACGVLVAARRSGDRT